MPPDIITHMASSLPNESVQQCYDRLQAMVGNRWEVPNTFIVKGLTEDEIRSKEDWLINFKPVRMAVQTVLYKSSYRIAPPGCEI